MSTSREEQLDALAVQLREAAYFCTKLEDLEIHCEKVAAELARLAATPKAGVNATDDSLAKTVTTAVLSALKAGGDNLTIFNAVKQALPSVLGGVDQKTTQTTKPSSSRAEDSASETAVSALAALADELEAAANWMQLYLDTYGEIGDDATQANIDDWHDVVKRARKSSDGGVVATTQASSSMEDKPDPLRRPVGGTINNHLSREAEVAPGPSEANSPAAPVAIVSYTNYRGETSVRRIIPKAVRYGSTEWHPEPQWLLLVWDADKQADREFALKDFGAAPVDAGVREALELAEEIDRTKPYIVFHYPGPASKGLNNEKTKLIIDALRALTNSGARDALDSIATAEGMLSAHIEEFHDFEYEPHSVPPELAGLLRIQHHLAGSLINEDGAHTLSSQPVVGVDQTHPSFNDAIEAWQSIETAPKDGPFLICGTWLGEPIVRQINGMQLSGKPSTLVSNICPTHWMPLPEPPSSLKLPDYRGGEEAHRRMRDRR